MSNRQRLSVEERRSLILDAATHAFGQAEYAHVSVGAIAKEARSSQALVFHYFGSKAGLYAEVLAGRYECLQAAHRTADQALPSGSTARDRIQRGIDVYLDHITTHPELWMRTRWGGTEPEEATRVRRRVHNDYVKVLHTMLDTTDTWPRHAYAVQGFLGFLDVACTQWAEAGCADDERQPLKDASLGALEGSLGDWG